MELRRITVQNQERLVRSEIRVISTFRDLAETEFDLGNQPHAKRLIELGMDAVRGAQTHLPGLSQDNVEQLKVQLAELGQELRSLKKRLKRPARRTA